MAKTVKLDNSKKQYATQKGPLGSPAEQEGLNAELGSADGKGEYVPRKMSEIIKDKREALKKK